MDGLPIGAEQPVDRLVQGLAGEVPQRDVHGPDGADGRVAIPLPRLLVEALAVQRVLADQQWLEELDQRLAVEMGAAHGRAEEGMAAQSLVRLEGQQTELAA